MIPFLAEASTSKLPDYGIIALFTVAGGAVGWFLAQIKAAVEIRNLQSDTANNIATFIYRIQDRHQEYIQACVECGILAGKITAEIQGAKNIALIRSLRDEFASVLFHRVVIKLHQYMELECERYKKQQDDLRDVIDFVLVADIRKITEWIGIINNSNLISRLNVNPATIERGWLLPFNRPARYVSWRRREEYRTRIRQELDKLVNESRA